MKSQARRFQGALAVVLLAASACASSPPAGDEPGAGGDPETGGHGGSASAMGGHGAGGSGRGGSGGTGGSVRSGGTGGPGSGGATGGSGGGAAPGDGGPGVGPGDDGPAGPSDAGTGPGGEDAPAIVTEAGSPPPGPGAYGGPGEHPHVPLQYTATPVPPLVAAECPDDPTKGFTEYQDSFVVQRPYDLAASDRFKYENGIYTFWVQSGDKAHQPGNTTQPRTEARYSNFTTGEHIWSADVMYESPSKTCVMQIHNTVAAIAMYLRIVGNRMFNLSTGKTILMDSEKKWFNLKVAFNTQTLEVRIFINDCLKETSHAPKGTPNWYFKNGVYTCDSGTCRSNYKNLHLYQKGSTDKFPMP